MDRLIATNSVPFANADTAPATGTAQYATSGNPVTNTPATIFPAYAWNMLQDEIYNVIIAAGLTPNRNAWNQLLTAIETMLQGSTTNVGVDTGAANAYVVAFTPALTAPVPWVPFWFKVKTTNTGASTLNATGTVEPLVGGAHLALQGGEMVANGNALVYWNPTLNSNAGAYVLLFCSGAAEQIAPGTQPLHALQLQQNTGIVGTVQNLKAYLAAAGTSLTFTADEIAIKGAFGGQSQIAASFNQTLSTSNTNAIGGIVGAALAANGFVGVYAAYNPSSGAYGIYGKNAAALLSTVDTSLTGWIGVFISLWRLNGSTQFVNGSQRGRTVTTVPFNVLTQTTGFTASSITSLNIAAAVNPNVIEIAGELNLVAGSGVANLGVQAYGDINGIDASGNQIATSGNTTSQVIGLYRVQLTTAQTTFYAVQWNTAPTSATLTMSVNRYTF